MNQAVPTDLNQLLAWAKGNLETNRDLELTIQELGKRLETPGLSSFGQGMFHYFQALAYVYTAKYEPASESFKHAVNNLIGHDELFLEVLGKFISFMEQIGMLEYALMLCDKGLKLYPGLPDLIACRGRLQHKQLEAPYREVSNLAYWQQLQEQGYFEHHVHYQAPEGLISQGGDLEQIARYHQLGPNQQVVVIGCGYGRESALIAPEVVHVWGIDVSEAILAKASQHLAVRGLSNFTPVLAADWQAVIPTGIDLVYCYTVFQHLTKFLVQDYVIGLAAKLRPGGSLICQFMYSVTGSHDAPLSVTEPHVSWSKPEIAQLFARAGLELAACDEVLAVPEEEVWWYWVHGVKKGVGSRE